MGCGTTVGCVFPFIFHGKTYNTCAHANQDSPWCSSEVDADGNHIGTKVPCSNDELVSCREYQTGEQKPFCHSLLFMDVFPHHQDIAITSKRDSASFHSTMVGKLTTLSAYSRQVDTSGVQQPWMKTTITRENGYPAGGLTAWSRMRRSQLMVENKEHILHPTSKQTIMFPMTLFFDGQDVDQHQDVCSPSNTGGWSTTHVCILMATRPGVPQRLTAMATILALKCPAPL